MGFGDGKGGFNDKVALSDNAFALAAPEEGFSFKINFGNRPESEVVQKLTQAVSFVTQNRDNAILAEAAEKRASQKLAAKDDRYENIAAQIQLENGSNNTEDESIVRQYIKSQIQKVLPNAEVKISLPENATSILHIYGVKTQERDIEILLPKKQAAKIRETLINRVDGEDNHFDKLSTALAEKLTLTRSEFAMINGITGGSTLIGGLIGSSARLAAEISGALQERVKMIPTQSPNSLAQGPG